MKKNVVKILTLSKHLKRCTVYLLKGNIQVNFHELHPGLLQCFQHLGVGVEWTERNGTSGQSEEDHSIYRKNWVEA